MRSNLTKEQIESRIQDILREQHRRKMFYCLDAIRSIGIFKEYKRKWVIKWLDGICLEKIRPLWSCKGFKPSDEE